LAVAVALLLCIALGASTAAATHFTKTGSPAGPTVPWGFNEDWGFSGVGAERTWTPELTTEHINLASAIMPDSLSTNRFHVRWADIEVTQDDYNWEKPQAVYEAMDANSVEPVMVISQAPTWAREPGATCPSPDPCAFPPADAEDIDDEWEEFVSLAVARYPNVRAIEVWNEPNLARFWAPAPDPARYVQILALAYDAAVAAGKSAPVITGALSPVRKTSDETPPRRISSRVFLREIYNQGCACDFEGIGAHPFAMNKHPVNQMWRELDRLFEVRDNHDDSGTPLWITEVSVSSDRQEGVGLMRQGRELVSLYHSIEGHEIESFIIHRLHDVTDETPYWNHTGVVDENLVPKPAYCHLGAAIGTPCGTDAQ
jgi:GH35 family endo-1,4-beta-xylanase